MIRGIFRLLWLGGVVAAAALDALRIKYFYRDPSGARVLFTSRWARQFLRCFGVTCTVQGSPPVQGVLASNHLSYLDILVLASVAPMTFVAKAEVSRWPVFGWLCRQAGTLFIRRDQRMDVQRLSEEMSAQLNRGTVVALFPEGTSTGGTSVLPFHSSLFAPLEGRDIQATPAFIQYQLADGSVENDVCYWRNMTFAWHLLNLLTKRQVSVSVKFGNPVCGVRNRKQLATELHRRVRQLGGFTASTVSRGLVERATAATATQSPKPSMLCVNAAT